MKCLAEIKKIGGGGKKERERAENRDATWAFSEPNFGDFGENLGEDFGEKNSSLFLPNLQFFFLVLLLGFFFRVGKSDRLAFFLSRAPGNPG